MSGTKEKSSKVPFRNFLGRLFNTSIVSNGNDGSDSVSTKSTISEISGPFNTVHNMHVGFDGTTFSGLPQSWLNILHRDLT